MLLPTERITFDRQEISDICAGLNKLLNGLAEIRVSNRLSPEMIFPILSSKYQPRTFSEQLASRILSLRNRLAAASQQPSSKHRLDCIEFAIIAFAVRLVRGKNASIDLVFDRKLEKYRKRAKRRTHSKLGDEVYQSAMREWEAFRNWMRFNLLTLRIPQRPFFRRLQREQRAAMLALAKQVIEERCTERLDEERLRHLVMLAIAEIRRRRHHVGLRTLLSDAEAAKDFLFRFIEKRAQLNLRLEFMSGDRQAAIRGDQMRAALGLPVGASTESTSELGTISDTKVISRVARFFDEEILPADWDHVQEQVELMAPRCRLKRHSIPANSLEDVITMNKPSSPAADNPEERNQAAETLLAILFTLNASPSRAVALIRSGWAMAKQKRFRR